MEGSDMPAPRPARTARRGFTIIELLIVIAIILAIGGLVLVNVLGASEKADRGTVMIQIQAFDQAVSLRGRRTGRPLEQGLARG